MIWPAVVMIMQIVLRVDDAHADDGAVLRGDVEGLDADAAAGLGAVLGQERALAVALAGGDQRSQASPGRTTPMPITASSPRRWMPCTPAAVRPMDRTCSSGKRIDMPFWVTMMISRLAVGLRDPLQFVVVRAGRWR